MRIINMIYLYTNIYMYNKYDIVIYLYTNIYMYNKYDIAGNMSDHTCRMHIRIINIFMYIYIYICICI